MVKTKTCLSCKTKLIGRTDKKFCSDACRNSYNNELNKDRNNLMRNIHNMLRKNYRVLEKLNPNGKTTVPKKKLLSNHFSFEYITSIYTTKKGSVYFFVYDQGYLPLENDMYMLVKRE